MSIHVVGIIGLVVVFLVGTLRPINLGALALVMMFVHGPIFGQSVQDMYRGPPMGSGNERMVAQILPRWTPLTNWMRQIEDFQGAA